MHQKTDKPGVPDLSGPRPLASEDCVREATRILRTDSIQKRCITQVALNHIVTANEKNRFKRLISIEEQSGQAVAC